MREALRALAIARDDGSIVTVAVPRNRVRVSMTASSAIFQNI
jgi:hypothetical protein